MGNASALYLGAVMHRRLRPKRHKLRYSMFSMLIDLDELTSLDSGLRLFSRNRFNLFSFRDADYGVSKDIPLKQQIERIVCEAGFQVDGGPVRLLTMPRLLGYSFNPLNVYFVYLRSGALEAIVCEVNNTFSQRHAYVMSGRAMPGQNDGAPVRALCKKRFYVSPFNGMDLTYDFRIEPPTASCCVAINVSDGQGALISAVHASQRATLDDTALLRACLAYPLLGLKVIGGIHWEALKLWLKGVKLQQRPPPPENPVTVIPRTES
jgi:DUF1365 family protein